MSRPDGRRNDELRSIEIIPRFQKHPHGSVLIKTGDTWVLCSAFAEDGAPPFVEDPSHGWVTAEYAMLPGATTTRGRRSAGGRVKEIQRLIGRSLRAGVDLSQLGPRTITVDCDVLQADGGTRVASITGGYVAMALAVARLRAQDRLAPDAEPITEPIAAVSVGVVDGEARLDLPYEEDAKAEVDMNVVMAVSGDLIEVQGTAERGVFSRKQLDELLDLAHLGIAELCAAQRAILTTST